MTYVRVDLTGADRESLVRAEAFLRAQVQYLDDTGSRVTLPEIKSYLSTVERLSSVVGPAQLSGEDASHLQQTRVLLEGARNGYRSAEFDDRAAKVDQDVVRLADIIKAANEQLARSS